MKKPRLAANPAATGPHARPERAPLQPSGPLYALMATALALAAALWILPAHVAPPLVLPIVSTVLILAAMLAALLAWRRPAPDSRVATYWDVSAALTMAGVSAALLSEPEAVLPLLEQQQWSPAKTETEH